MLAPRASGKRFAIPLWHKLMGFYAIPGLYFYTVLYAHTAQR